MTRDKSTWQPNELMNQIHSRGGRFLCLSECNTTDSSSNIIDDGIWVEASKKVAQIR